LTPEQELDRVVAGRDVPLVAAELVQAREHLGGELGEVLAVGDDVAIDARDGFAGSPGRHRRRPPGRRSR
jgi:hypothetical protein